MNLKHPKDKILNQIRVVTELNLENEIDEMENAVEDHAKESLRRRRHLVWGNRTLWFVALTAVAIALSYVVLLQMPEGGEVTFLSMLVVCLIGYILGPAEGVCGAALFGLIKYFIDYGMVQTNFAELWDYLIGYLLLGICGVLANTQMRSSRTGRMEYLLGLRSSMTIAVLLRFLESVWNYLYFYPVPGMPFMAQLKEAVIYCSIYIFPELVFSLIVLSVPAVMKAVQFLRIMANEDYAERYDYY
ncbi:MAG: energy-coupled thiamine transporter ThiT [Lachnospiraceae bacterium]|nr:energy-coupled thiamine transporter ThiT [Lachnospiraceae bacterium]